MRSPPLFPHCRQDSLVFRRLPLFPDAAKAGTVHLNVALRQSDQVKGGAMRVGGWLGADGLATGLHKVLPGGRKIGGQPRAHIRPRADRLARQPIAKIDCMRMRADGPDCAVPE